MKHLLAVAMLAGLTFTVSARAEEKKHEPHDSTAVAPGKDAKAKAYPLNFCVVSDEKFEGSGMKPVELVYTGQTMKFCCKDCVKDFKKDPKKYLTKLNQEVKKQDEAKAKK